MSGFAIFSIQPVGFRAKIFYDRPVILALWDPLVSLV
jgi:hypothetical protein